MIRIPGSVVRLCEGPSRRDLLRGGALGGIGLSLPGLFRLAAAQPTPRRPTADACILASCWGTPGQFETFDPKPEAPSGIRGEFGHTPRINPQAGRVFTPADVCATVYSCLGIDPHTAVRDALGKPTWLSDGRPMREVF